jgi:hypothetical protein
VSALVGMILTSACGPLAQAPAGSPSPAQATAVSPTSAQAGYLEGRASIGPLQPVERIGVPTPTPPPAACTSRGLVVFAADTGTEVRHITFEADCTYRVSLPPGSYRVELDRRGIDTSRDLPRTVTIQAGQTTRLDVSIDTGIR